MNCLFCGCPNPEHFYSGSSVTSSNGFHYCNQCLPKIKSCMCGRYYVPNLHEKVCDVCAPSYCKFCLTKTDTEICKDCLPKVVSCDDCGAPYIGGTLCHKCIASYKSCALCNTLFRGEGILCPSCVETSVQCSCGKIVHKDKVLIDTYGEHIKKGCPCCRCTCVACGGTSLGRLCLECEIEHYEGEIKSYSYKPAPLFLGSDPADKLYIGIENEVAFPATRVKAKVKYCGMLQKNHPNESHFYVKRDSSVDNGFEIVTHPMTFDYFNNQFPVSDLFIHRYTRSNDNCGMHIHMSKSAFGNAQIYKFMNFVHNNQDFITKVAERTPNTYCNAIKKETFIYKAKDKSGSDRDQVNLIPKDTIELRIFRGAINEKQYRKNVEFAVCLFNFTKKCSVVDTTEAKFREYLAANTVLYPNLVWFLAN